MALPNYSPEGVILFGSVPWDNGYNHVRLYNSLDEQYKDIRAQMLESSYHYVYIGRDRRLKVDIEADRLYHCNYCMYRNESLTDGWIYCFISDVTYVNDHTTEITMETDVFQTYLHGVDWVIPDCFIERETVPSESEKYLTTPEPSFDLLYTVDDEKRRMFRTQGMVIMSTEAPVHGTAAPWNLSGWDSTSVDTGMFYGLPQGARSYYIPLENGAIDADKLSYFLRGITDAGTVESVISMFTIPDFVSVPGRANDENNPDTLPTHFVFGSNQRSELADITNPLYGPDRGNTLDGYKPENRKMLYYPYTFCHLTDYNGSSADLRYELMGDNNHFIVKYVPNGMCEGFVAPSEYRGIYDLDSGITFQCGAMGTWNNQVFQTWLAQNGGKIALEVISTAAMAFTGIGGIAKGASMLAKGNDLARTVLAAKHTSTASAALNAEKAAGLIKGGQAAQLAGAASVGSGLNKGGNLAATAYDQSRQPSLVRGQLDNASRWQNGIQGIGIQKICCTAEYAQRIDKFFKIYGYAVDDVEAVKINSRQSFNYVKTGDSVPKSTDSRAGINAPFTRGRGTPATALAVIKAAFDGGITFWHTTDGFGDYSLANPIV